MEEQELRAITKNKESAKKRLLSLLRLHPQAFRAGTGAEVFVEEFIRAFTKYLTFSDNEIFVIEEMSQIIIDYPQIISPETDAEYFLEDLNNAAIKYFGYFGRPKKEY